MKFTAEYSRAKIIFLDVTVIKKGDQLLSDLYIKPADTHQYLHASLCHVSHCKKSIHFSQALRLNRICSKNMFFDKWCNKLEIWLKERGYSEKLVKGQILKKVPIIGFRRAKGLKDHLVIFRGTRCEICKHVVTTETFRSFSTQRDYCIKPDNLNCRSSNVVYHFSCKACSKQYIGSTESF